MRRLGGLLILVLALTTVSAKVEVQPCSPTDACFPWTADGPACVRAERINLRFQLELQPENAFIVPGVRNPVTDATYAFCPRVDEVMAVNISRVGELAVAVNASKTTPSPETAGGGVEDSGAATEWVLGSRRRAYIRAIGMGEFESISFPKGDSQGLLMVSDTSSDACPNKDVAVVPFATLNVSLINGMFKYYDGYPQPAGVGFVPSCYEGLCIMDSTMQCIGPAGRQHCARCVNAPDAAKMALQIWVAYFGTDRDGRALRSGSNSPLNFQKFSGSSVANSLNTAFQGIQSGEVLTRDSLEP